MIPLILYLILGCPFLIASFYSTKCFWEGLFSGLMMWLAWPFATLWILAADDCDGKIKKRIACTKCGKLEIFYQFTSRAGEIDLICADDKCDNTMIVKTPNG